jgi:hypothetical protein
MNKYFNRPDPPRGVPDAIALYYCLKKMREVFRTSNICGIASASAYLGAGLAQGRKIKNETGFLQSRSFFFNRALLPHLVPEKKGACCNLAAASTARRGTVGIR